MFSVRKAASTSTLTLPSDYSSLITSQRGKSRNLPSQNVMAKVRLLKTYYAIPVKSKEELLMLNSGLVRIKRLRRVWYVFEKKLNPFI